jgi:hypothetical protein
MKMAAGSFKTDCLAILDEVQAKRETVEGRCPQLTALGITHERMVSNDNVV